MKKQLFFLILFIISSIISSISYSLTPKIAVVPIGGVLTTNGESSLTGSSISSREIASILNDATDDNSIKAVLIDINSPGGSPVASEEISRAIVSLKAEKPVYCLINDIGASGAFWIAVSCDKVYASSMSIVGSIGVTSAGLGFENFIKDYNITYRRQTAGEFKDMGTPFREMSEDEEQIIQKLLDNIHNKFITHVANSRGMNRSTVVKLATGEVFLGDEAKKIGFIDEIGYYPDVIEELKNITTKNAIVVDFGPEPTLAELIGLNSLFKMPSAESQILLK